LLVAIARLEAVLRAAYREALQAACPDAWAKGRRVKILEFCVEPRTQQQIRDHVGSIAGSEVKEYLEEGRRCGVLASFGTGSSERYLTVLFPPGAPRRKRRASRPRPDKAMST